MNSVIYSLFESSNPIKKPEPLFPWKPNPLAHGEVDLPILLLLEPQSVLYCLNSTAKTSVTKHLCRSALGVGTRQSARPPQEISSKLHGSRGKCTPRCQPTDRHQSQQVVATFFPNTSGFRIKEHHINSLHDPVRVGCQRGFRPGPLVRRDSFSRT